MDSILLDIYYANDPGTVTLSHLERVVGDKWIVCRELILLADHYCRKHAGLDPQVTLSDHALDRGRLHRGI